MILIKAIVNFENDLFFLMIILKICRPKEMKLMKMVMMMRVKVEVE